jgi:hypothetical protein
LGWRELLRLLFGILIFRAGGDGRWLVSSRVFHEGGGILFGSREERGAEATALQALREV